MTDNWLITGGCGFIGRSLIKELLSREPRAAIRVFDNLTVGTRDDLAGVCAFTEKSLDELGGPPSGVELVKGDIRDYPALEKSSRGMDVIVHLAANTGVPASVENPRADMEANIIGVFNALEAARSAGVGRFVFASSAAPIGEAEPPIHEELACKPVSPYGASKLAGEAYCSAYGRTFGVATVALRFGNVYGPLSGRKSSVVAKFIKKACAGEKLEIYGDGGQTRDFIYVADLVEAVLAAASARGVAGEIFQIATSLETTVGEMTDKLVAALEARGVSGIEVFHSAERLGDVKRNYSDTSKAARLLGWQAKTSLDEGLEKTVDWFLRG